MDRKVKWGVIASGGIARRRTIPEGIIPCQYAQLISVYDIDPELNKNVAKEFETSAAGSIDELLDSDIEAVYIASPVNMHPEHILMCIERGKHILCEKPLCRTTKEVQRIIEARHNTDILLGIGFMMRFQTQHQAALKLIKDGRLGKPVYGRAQLSCWYPAAKGAWRQDPKTGGGGALMDMGSHCIDLLEMFFGRIKTVSCFINNCVHSYKSEDSAVVSLFFENGALATVDTFFCIPDNSSKNVLELYGSKGSIIAKNTLGQGIAGEMTAYLEEANLEYNSEQTRSLNDGIKIEPKPRNSYLAEIEEFSKAIIEKREPVNNITLGLRNQQIISACYNSAKSGNIIKINQ